MKKIKTYEDFNEIELNNETELKIKPSDLSSLIDDILSNDNFDQASKHLSSVSKEYPYIKTDPELKKIYYNGLKKWHAMLQKEK